MFKKPLIVTLCAFFSFLFSGSQNRSDSNFENYEVSGTILDSLRSPVPGAAIIFKNIIDENDFTLISDYETGAFKILLPQGEYILKIKALGFFDHVENLIVNESLRLGSIVLKEKKERLDEVIIRAKINKMIKHSANGVTINIQKDSILKDISLLEILPNLPGVQVRENNNILLEGELAKVFLDGKFQNISQQNLNLMLYNLIGDDIEEIELISNPSAKYDSSIKKVINIKTKKRKNEGLDGIFINRLTNADFSINPSLGINYKLKKFIFSVNLMPYSYSELTSKSYNNRRLVDNSYQLIETIDRENNSHSNDYNFNLDFSVNDNQSLYINYGISNYSIRSEALTMSTQFSNSNMVYGIYNENKVNDKSTVNSFNFGYRNDIGDEGIRLDLAAGYKFGKDDTQRDLENSEMNLTDDSEVYQRSLDNINARTKEFSSRIDVYVPIEVSSKKIEAGIKYDNLLTSDKNNYRDYNEDINGYQVNDNFSNSFEYKENSLAFYTSFDNDLRRLKYSLGLRYEIISTNSISIFENLTTERTYKNFIPVISVKYMTNKKETSNINMSFRRGFILPPYIYLNSFESPVNSTTIRKGNPHLEQSDYINLNLGYTLNNKYFFSSNYYYYDNYFAQTEILEDGNTILTYNNLGNRRTLRFNFSTNYDLSKWWRLYINTAYDYKETIGDGVNSSVNNFFLSFSQIFKPLEDFQINLVTSFSNGNSSSFELNNDFLRFYSSVSISKWFLKKRLLFNLRANDLFGVNNKNENIFLIDETEYMKKETYQAPKIFFNITYRFESGDKINKKSKRKSEINRDRL